MDFYPPNSFGPLMKGLVIGGLGIFHVFLAQFAIGGGMLMTYLEWLHQRGRARDARLFLGSFFRALVLVSFVTGAVTGVGMWLTAIQISPRTIGRMVEHFHWVWAIEWTFFCVEVMAGYAFYRYGERLSDRGRLFLLGSYSAAAWFSLFWINGILSWQLTPGRWLESFDVWDGFFNPSFWPSLFFRTVAAMATAALVAIAVVNTMKIGRARRHRLLRTIARFLFPMVFMPLLGVWYLATIPADSRSWILGGSVAMSLFFGLGVAASTVIAIYAFGAVFYRRLYMNGATATLLAAMAFGATAGGEFVREGGRKPYTIRQVLYSNSIAPSEVAKMRVVGSTAGDPYPVSIDAPNEELVLGARVHRVQCSVCHTMEGVNGLVHLTSSWDIAQMRMNIAKLQQTKSFMPPFAGTPEELEALVQFIRWTAADEPKRWEPAPDRAEALGRIADYLEEAEPPRPAGNEPGSS